MLLIFAIENGKTRMVPGVTDLYAFGDSLIYHRKDQKQPLGHTGPKLGLMLDIDFLCKRYQCAYVICHIKDCSRMGVGDGLIKWLIWKGQFIGDLTESEAHRHIRMNPL